MKNYLTKQLFGAEQVDQALDRGQDQVAIGLLYSGVAVASDRGWLHRAAERGNLELARWLVWNGDEADRVDEYGQLPLHRAIRNGHVELAKLLMVYTSGVNQPNGQGVTPLMEARRAGLDDLVETLEELSIQAA